MTEDYTQHQTLNEQLEAERLSKRPVSPPAEIPGFRVEKFLGEGAFGQVWVGSDMNTGRRVAVKFYLHRSGVNWSLLSREVNNLVALSADRHVVQVLEVGWDSEPPYYVMEYIENGSLEELLRSRGPLSVEHAVAMFSDLCTGLNHTHGKGILHCDLKPANILLDEDFRPRLADFGQSRMSHEQVPALGTLFYMAPEQADLDSTPDARWDVYGMGAILYRMLTGHAPHRDPDLLRELDTEGSLPKRLEKYRESIAQSDPVSLHRSIPGVDRKLAEIIEKCLATQPENRYSNVQQIVEALQQREAAKARKPLILLGLVGPLLLITATCLYATRTIRETGKQFKTALRQERAKTNLSAAGEKARALEIELRSYFDLVAGEAADVDFQKIATQTLNNPKLIGLRDQIADQNEAVDAREEILDQKLCCSLDDYLAQRLKLYNARAEVEAGLPRLATMFVTDSRGTIVGIAYANPVARELNSSGKNYAYRTYFTGKKEDMPKGISPEKVDSIVHSTHLSSAFQSTATGLWKIAVSTPIRLPEVLQESQRGAGIDGVFVATTNFGDFEQFRSYEEQGEDAIGVLVDARSGPLRGTILQHPWMLDRGEDPADRNAHFQVPGDVMEDLLDGGDFDYVDPIAKAPGGQTYQGDWIAAVHSVRLPRMQAETKASESDLIVLVQFRLSETYARVEALTDKLVLEGAVALIGILLINGTMWYFVRKVTLSESGDQLQADEQVPIAMQETISIQ